MGVSREEITFSLSNASVILLFTFYVGVKQVTALCDFNYFRN